MGTRASASSMPRRDRDEAASLVACVELPTETYPRRFALVDHVVRLFMFLPATFFPRLVVRHSSRISPASCERDRIGNVLTLLRGEAKLGGDRESKSTGGIRSYVSRVSSADGSASFSRTSSFEQDRYSLIANVSTVACKIHHYFHTRLISFGVSIPV